MPSTTTSQQQDSQAVKVVAIGGGTGLSTLLRGLKAYTPHITAIVTVADDGGSSGRLRRSLGVLPPGDLRTCIAALADDEALLTQLFQYRFGHGEELDGHCFGNLFITALAAVTGSFERAILEAGRVLAIQGRILPSTLQNVTLVADLRAEPAMAAAALTRIEGESAIPKAGWPIERVCFTTRGGACLSRGGAGHPGRRPDHRRAGQPVHQHSAQPAGGRHPARGGRLAGLQAVRVQRRHPAGRDRRL